LRRHPSRLEDEAAVAEQRLVREAKDGALNLTS
jgi:hypothetical protein